MDLGLQNKVALIAGSSRGIGKAIAAQLLAEGALVCVTGKNEIALDACLKELEAKYPAENVLAVSGDLTEIHAIQSVLAAIRDKWGRLDVLVANLGSGSGKPGWDQSEEEWDRIFRVNFWGSVRLARAAIPGLIEQGGAIVFLASIVGLEMTLAPIPYSAAKAALINYSKNLARTLATDGVRVNSVAPGNILFSGGSWERHLNERREQVEQYIAKEVPLQRFGTPDEIASLVIFLCSAAAGFSTGACYVMDGGQTRRI